MKAKPTPSAAPPMPHFISLSDRHQLSATGVREVDSFDDTAVVVHTEQGELTIKGDALHISRLNVETGDLTVEGRIDSLSHAELRTHGGWFGKLFR
jgi:sporulation protein YabP